MLYITVEYLKNFRYPNDHKIFTCLLEILMENFVTTHDQFYPVMAVEAINVIYKVNISHTAFCP